MNCMDGLEKTMKITRQPTFWPLGQAHPEYKSGITTTPKCLVHVPIKYTSTENKIKMFSSQFYCRLSDPRP
jgi:hypothetical protein